MQPGTKRIIHVAVFVVGLALILMDIFIEPKWEEISSSEGAFKVMMPGTPTKTHKAKSGEAFSTEQHTFMLDLRSGAYAITYYDIPEDVPLKPPEGVLEVNRNGMVKGTGGRLVSEKAISLNGHPGVEVVIETPDTPPMRGRIFYVDRRIYALITATSEPENGEKFLDSFKLLGQ